MLFIFQTVVFQSGLVGNESQNWIPKVTPKPTVILYGHRTGSRGWPLTWHRYHAANDMRRFCMDRWWNFCSVLRTSVIWRKAGTARREGGTPAARPGRTASCTLFVRAVVCLVPPTAKIIYSHLSGNTYRCRRHPNDRTIIPIWSHVASGSGKSVQHNNVTSAPTGRTIVPQCIYIYSL